MSGPNRSQSFIGDILEIAESSARRYAINPLYLGGTSGSQGGVGGPPGGVIGRLSQRYVAYDTDEAASSSGSSSLLDNLNHMRQRLAYLEASGGGTYTPGSVPFASSSGSLTQDNGAFYYDDANNSLLVGDITHVSYVSPSYALHVANPGGSARLRLFGFGGQATIAAYSANGTPESPIVTNNADVIMSFSAQGWDGSAFEVAGRIRYIATEDYTSGSHGSKIVFQATPTGYNAPIDVVTVLNGEMYNSSSGSDLVYYHSGNLPSITGDHNTLTGLTTGDPHTQYLYLGGRSGGQSVYGGSNPLNNLYLHSTSGSAPGTVYICPTSGSVALYGKYFYIDGVTKITGGGTLALASYTLTVAATGTAALGTGAANTLTRWSGTNTVTNIANATGYLYNDGAGAFSYVSTAAPSAHNILSTSHGDSTAAACVRGDIITGQGASPKWTRLAKGTANRVLTGDGTDIQWSDYLISGTAGKAITLTGSLVIEVDTTVTGGGVIALRGYTLTVPATGTVALLGVANAFTDSNTIASGKFLTCLTDGNTGGLRAGASSDVLWHRGAENTWQTPDSVTVDVGLNVGSPETVAGTGDVAYSGALEATRSGTAYTGYIYVPLATPAVVYNSQTFSSVAVPTAISAATLGVPSGAQGIDVRFTVKDSGGAGYWFALGNSTFAIVDRAQFSQIANVWNEGGGFCRMYSGNIYYRVSASGVNTTTVTLYINGYYI